MNLGNDIKVSIIVPVYNAEEFIEECIKSVLTQSLKEIELIMIDDGSTDNSSYIINEFAKENERVILLKENNQGSGPARNLGIEKAKGEYIVFLDADDFLYDRNALEYMYNKGKEHGASICASYRVKLTARGFEENNYLNLKELSALPKWMRFVEVQNDWCYQSYMFSRRLLKANEIRFPAYLRGQDPPFLLAAMKQAKKFLLCPVKMYCYRWGHQKQDFSERQVLDILNGIYDVLKISIECHYYKLIETVMKRIKGGGYYFRFIKKYPSKIIAKRLNAINDLLINNGLENRLEILEEKEFRQYNDVKISVIVPVCNVEEYLEECLDSICGQDFDAFEIICVEDGSTDASYEILKEYEARDERIHIFHKAHEEKFGLSSARNYGIEKARGNYIVFVDGDDVLCTEKALSIIWNKVDENNLDLLFYDTNLIFSMEPEENVKKERIRYFERKKEYGLYDRACDLFADFVTNNDYITTAWGACVRKGVLFDFHIRFPVGRVNEDNSYMFELMLKAGKSMHIKKKIYGYRQRLNSIMYQNVSYNNVVDNIYILLEMEDLYKSGRWTKKVDVAIKNRISFQKWKIMDLYKNVKSDGSIGDVLGTEKRYILKSFLEYGKKGIIYKFNSLPQERPKAFWGMDWMTWIKTYQVRIASMISAGDFIVTQNRNFLGGFFHGMPVCDFETLLHCTVKPLVLVHEKDYDAVVRRLAAYGFMPGVDIFRY